MSDYRNFTRASEAGFDGLTPETAVYTQTKNVWTTVVVTEVGVFSPLSLGRHNTCSIARIMLEGTIDPDVDSIEVLDSVGTVRFAKPASLVSSGFFFLYPQDSIRITAPGARKADLLVEDLNEERLASWIETEITAQIAPPQGYSERTITNPGQMDPWKGRLTAFLELAAGGDVVLPALEDVALGDTVTFVRTAGAIPRIIADDALDEVNGLAGVVAGEYFLRSVTDAIRYTRVGGGWARKTGEQAPNAITGTANPIVVPPWTGGTLYLRDAGTAAGNVTQLPALADCRQGCRLQILADSTAPGVHALTAAGGDSINGKPDPFLYAVGDTLIVGDPPLRPVVTVEHAGTTWHVVADQPANQLAVNAPGTLESRGGVVFVRLNLAADGDVVLPDIAELPSGTSYFLTRVAGAGVPRITTTVAVNGVTGTVGYFLRSIGDSVTYRTGGGGWTRPFGDGSPPTLITAANTVLAPFVGEQYITTTGPLNQSVTLPDYTLLPVGTKVYHYNDSAFTHVLTPFAGQLILGAVTGTVVTKTGFVLYWSGDTTVGWMGWATP